MNIKQTVAEKLMDLGNLSIAGVLFGNVLAVQKGEVSLGWIAAGILFAGFLYTCGILIAKRP